MSDSNDVISLKDYQGKFNVLVPTTTMKQISPFHRIRVEEVTINPDPEAGDVFKVGSKKVNNSWEDVLSLSKTAIMRLAAAAGVIWNWNETRVVSASGDYVLYQAVGAIRKASGEWLPLKATKEIDLNVIEEETYESNLKKAKSLAQDKRNGLTPEAWATAQTHTNMIQWRKNKLMRAETGAMLRVVRALLSVKHQYSPAELKKPFAVPTVDFSPDYNDPEVKAAVLQQGLKAGSELFGASAPQLIQPTTAFTNPGQMPDMGQAIDIDASDNNEPESPPFDTEQDDSFPPDLQPPSCSDCGEMITDHGDFRAGEIAEKTEATYGTKLCWTCAQKRKGGDKK